MSGDGRSTHRRRGGRRFIRPQGLIWGAALAVLLVPALPGRWMPPEAGGRLEGPSEGRASGREPRVTEDAAFAALRDRFSRPAHEAGLDRESWAKRQVGAIRAHLRRFPETRHPGRIYPWLAVTELEVLNRPRAAEATLDAWEGRIDSADEEARTAILRLRTRVSRRLGDSAGERAVLRKLATRCTGAERKLVVGRLDELMRLAPGCRLPVIGGRDLGGAAVGPERWRGRVLIVELWDPTGPDAGSRVRELQALRRDAGARGLVVIGVPLARSRAAVETAVGRHSANWPQLFENSRPGNDHPVATCLSPSGRRARFIVDRSGVIRARDLRGERLKRLVETLLEETGPGPGA